jgi:hypothetical protein
MGKTSLIEASFQLYKHHPAAAAYMPSNGCNNLPTADYLLSRGCTPPRQCECFVINQSSENENGFLTCTYSMEANIQQTCILFHLLLNIFDLK